ncbi:peptidase [Planomonospora parontospora subsp. parontospora]|uniref:Peptidase n=2 Tax=Planomonospora parontospora TaxID=58119 RepID=A0AA37BF05_9ACTN|nr:alpha/beta hydrolase [Planomonospora parontospora]GGK62541.1 peptidase [Planomonospora parontospora]GII08319.1 peptidase [Planomonospora parontospora subsp. parontospora]
MRPVRLTAIAAALPLALVTAGGPAAAANTGSGAGQGTIVWGSCAGMRPAEGQKLPTGTECGTLTVPLDHADPGGKSIELALIRIKATGSGKRLGSLVFNFGGPGGSGVDILPLAAPAYTALNARYDLVSFDPRGVERSSGVRCGDAAEMEEYNAADATPDTRAERARLKRATAEFVRACEKTSGEILPHVGTVNAARDLELLREALGESRLDYFGMSYGTHLGAVYATMFPGKVGRFLLDAPLDPTVSFRQRTLDQMRGFQRSYEAFLAACAAKGAGKCVLGADRKKADRTVRALWKRLDAKPLKVDRRELTQSLAVTGIGAALYAQQAWPVLEQALGAALKGDGRLLLGLADGYTGRRADGTYSTMLTSFPAISCADSAERPSAAEQARTDAAARKINPMFGGAGLGGLCGAWPFAGSNAAKKVDATGSAPIVVVATTGDPATPYAWGPKLTKQLRTAVLVTSEGEGHGAYGVNACTTKVADAYLIDGKVPAKGTVCGS